MEKVTLYVTQLEEALNEVQQEYLTMLSASEVQQHLRDHLFMGFASNCAIPCTTCKMTQG